MSLLSQAGDFTAVITGVLVGYAIALAVGVLVGAIILRASCSLFNLFAGGSKAPRAVPEPDFGIALIMAAVVLFVQFFASFLVGAAVGSAVQASGDPRGAQLMISLACLPVSFMVLAGVVSVMLPTGFLRAVGVAALGWVISLIMLVVVYGIITVFVIFTG